MINNVNLVGRVTKDLEARTSTSGNAICNFNLAVNRNFKNQNGEYEADFINCVIFGTFAQTMPQYVSKGSLIGVTGRIQTRNYENDMGQRVYVTEVVASNVAFLDTRNNNQSGNYSNNEPSPYDDIDDDLPF